MGAKKNKNGGENKNNEQQQQQQQKKNNDGGGGGGKKDGDGSITVVLKLDLHCEGCVTKIKNRVRDFQGVESVRGDLNSNKLTVTGKVDPAEVREMVEKKVKKKVELVSPTPKKDKDGGGGGGGGGGEKKGAEKKEAEPKKSKEPQVMTAVMKLNLHCQGCIQKIRRIVSKTKGYQEMSIDDQKNLIMVKGTMDMKTLAEALSERLRRPVEIVPPKNEAGDQKKDKEKGGDQKKEKGGGQKVKGGDEAAAGGDGGGGGGGGLGEENRMMQYAPYPYMYGYGYGNPVQVEHYPGNPVQVEHYPTPQMFSDENPNACSIM